MPKRGSLTGNSTRSGHYASRRWRRLRLWLHARWLLLLLLLQLLLLQPLLLLLRHVMADSTSCRGTQYSMMAGNVSRDRADSRSFDAPFGSGNLPAGLLVGKLAADLVFYGFAIVGYEIKKRWVVQPAEGDKVA